MLRAHWVNFATVNLAPLHSMHTGSKIIFFSLWKLEKLFCCCHYFINIFVSFYFLIMMMIARLSMHQTYIKCSVLYIEREPASRRIQLSHSWPIEYHHYYHSCLAVLLSTLDYLCVCVYEYYYYYYHCVSKNRTNNNVQVSSFMIFYGFDI